MYQLTWKCINPVCINKGFKEIVMEKRKTSEFNWCSYCNKFTLKLDNQKNLSYDAEDLEEAEI